MKQKQTQIQSTKTPFGGLALVWFKSSGKPQQIKCNQVEQIKWKGLNQVELIHR